MPPDPPQERRGNSIPRPRYRAPHVVSASRPGSGRFGFASPVGSGSPIEFPRRFRGRLRLRLVLCRRLCSKPRRAGVRLGFASGRGGQMVGKKENSGSTQHNRFRKIHRSVERSTVESTRAEDCPGRGGFQGEAQFQIYRLGTCPDVRERETREVFSMPARVCSQKITVNCVSVALSVSCESCSPSLLLRAFFNGASNKKGQSL